MARMQSETRLLATCTSLFLEARQSKAQDMLLCKYHQIDVDLDGIEPLQRTGLSFPKQELPQRYRIRGLEKKGVNGPEPCGTK
ncbi:MAG: hypothetical protein CM1200mP39_30110 [Dehalococcoidia bacterium]|nr:MAG: hypothetical protein CM1200mP39_30110 [Dehalococcoidia bacterium]